MSSRPFTPQEVIIKDLLDRSSPHCVYDLSTLSFVKAHTAGEYQLHNIMCHTTMGEQHSYQCVLYRYQKRFWEITMMAGGSGNVPPEPEKQGDLPEVHVWSFQSSGTLLPEPEFFACGEVRSGGASITNVRLLSSNNVVLEDLVEQDLLLFTSNRLIEFPLWVELYDTLGKCVNRYEIMKLPIELCT